MNPERWGPCRICWSSLVQFSGEPRTFFSTPDAEGQTSGGQGSAAEQPERTASPVEQHAFDE